MFFCRTFIVSQFQNASLGKAFELCFRKNAVREKIVNQWEGVVEGGSITLFCQKCFSLSADKMRSGTV